MTNIIPPARLFASEARFQRGCKLMRLGKEFKLAGLIMLAVAGSASGALLSDDFSGPAGSPLVGSALDVGGVWSNTQTDGGGAMNGKFIFAAGGGVISSNNLQASVYTAFNAGANSTTLTNGFTLSTTFAANGYSDFNFALGLAETINKGHFANLVTNDVIRFAYHVGGANAGTFDWAVFDASVSQNSGSSSRAGMETISSNDVIRLSITCYPLLGLVDGVATNVSQGYLLSRSRFALNTPGLTNTLYAGMGFTSLTISDAAAPAVVKSFGVTVEDVTVARPLVLASNLPPTMTGFAFDDFNGTNAANFPYVLGEHAAIDIMHAVRDSVYDTVRATYPEKIIVKQLAWGGTAGLDLTAIYPGHCLLKLGTKLSADIAATTNNTVLYLDDYTRIASSQSGIENITNTIESYVLLYALGTNGQPDWSRAEHVRLVSVDTGTGAVTVKRAQLGSSALAFTGGQAVVARHMMFWDNQWELNFSLQCPRGGPFNLTAAEWFALQMRQTMYLNDADGFEFDVGRWQWGFPSANKMDCNNDLVADYGYIDGISSFGMGGQVFQKRLRELLGPNKIIQTDGNDPMFGQRGLKYLNGVQMESFPTGGYDIYSERFLHLRMWVSNVVTYPAFSYPFTKTPTTLFGNCYDTDGSNVDWRFRVGFAAALLTGMPHPFASVTDINFDPANPEGNTANLVEDKGYYKWDEYVGGTNDLNNRKWLGPPLAAAVQITNNMGGSNLLAATVWAWTTETNFSASCSISNGTYSANISQIPANTIPWEDANYPGSQAPKALWFGTRLEATSGMPAFQPGREYTIEFEACGNDSWTNGTTVFDKVPRALTINGIAASGFHKPTSVALFPEWRSYRISIIADSVAPQPIIFGVSEQIGSAGIRNIRLYEGGAERWVREFANGIVLLNMTRASWYCELGQAYRHFNGNQHPEINNGQRVSPTVTVPVWDALYLVKTAGTNIILHAGDVFPATNGFVFGANDTLAGVGAVTGNVTLASGGGIVPGPSSGAAGTLAFSNNLTLNGQTMVFDLNGSPAAGNDKIVVTGNVTNNGNTTVSLNYIAGYLGAGTYTLMTYASRQGGTFVLDAAYPNVTLNVGATSLTVTVSAGGSVGTAYAWRGDGSANAWNTTAANWKFNNQLVAYPDGAGVLFDDTSSNLTVNLNTTVSPGSVTVNAVTTNNSYTFAGNGVISGAGSLTKNGNGQLTLNSTNTYGGGTIVNGGTLRINKKTSIGTGSLTVGSNALAYLDLANNNLTNIIVSAGALQVVNNGQLSGVISGNGSIYHAGSGAFTLTLSGTNSGFSGTITNAGTLKFGTRHALGSSTVYLGDGAVAGIIGLINSANGVTGINAVTNAIILLNDGELGNNQGPLELAGVISGGFGINKAGSSSVILSGGSTYTGLTTVSSGKLILKAAGGVGSPIPASSGISVNAGATLDVSQVAGGFVVLSGQSFGGSGTVTGAVTVANGGSLAPGLGGIGTLTLNGALTLAGSANLELGKAGAVLTRDQVTGLASLTYGGNLVVASTGDALQAGDSFTLFSATSYAGSFATLTLPTLTSGLFWDVSKLNVNGSIAVIAAPVANDQGVSTPEDVAANLVLTASDIDSPSLTYAILNGAAHGSLTGLNPTTGAVTYTPAGNYSGADSFTFTAYDGSLYATGTVFITVTAVNDAPVANSQSPTTSEDVAANLVLTASDIDSGSLTYAVLANPAHGSLSGFNPTSGAATYTPTADYNGADSFTFTAYDGSLYVTGTVSLTVTAVNDAPVANNQSVTTPQNTVTNLVLTASDIDSGSLTYSIVSNPSHGGLSGLNTNSGLVTYTPTAGYSGADSFSFRVYDGGLYATGTVSITVTQTVFPPAIVLTSPTNNASYTLPATITLNASVTTNGNTINKVQFYGNGTNLLNETTVAPFTYAWTNAVRGSHTLTAVLTYNGSSTTNSAEVNIAVLGLPAPWLTGDIGTVGLQGGAWESNGVYTVKGAGVGIVSTADGCRFVYQTASGDCTNTVRVVSIGNTNATAKVGVMIRETLAANAREAGTWVTPTNGIIFTTRTSTGGSTSTSTSTGKQAPYWVRILRTGNSFRSYYSTNGTSWTQLGSSTTISMGSSTYIGIGTTSGVTNTLSTGVSDSVTIIP